MAVDVLLCTSEALGFDLDVNRPYWASSQSETRRVKRDNFYTNHCRHVLHAVNWNRVGDEIIVPLTIEEMADITIIVIVKQNVGYDGMQHTARYIARVNGLRVNETGRTIVDYDIDWAETYMAQPVNGRCLRCPNGHFLAVSTPVSPRYWVVNAISAGATLPDKKVYIGLTLSKLNGHSGTFFCLVDADWTGQSDDPLRLLVNQTSMFVWGDIVGAWVVPAVVDLDSLVGLDVPGTGWVGWHEENVSGVEKVDRFIWTDSPTTTYLHTTLDCPNVKTDLANGMLGVVADDRGTLLYTVPDQRETTAHVSCTLNMSMTTFEIDVELSPPTSPESHSDIKAHLTDMLFTYSCKPLDAVMEAWKEYATRQRQADIDNRSLQNNRALGNTASSVLTGAATGAVVGSIAPGVGNVVGAIVGGVGGLASGLLGYGIDVNAGGKEQSILDRAAQLAQDTLSLTGAVTAKLLSGEGNPFYFVQLVADEVTMAHIQNRNKTQGVNADGVIPSVAQIMNNWGVSHSGFQPWAFEVEVSESMPTNRRRQIQETYRNGARWKYMS